MLIILSHAPPPPPLQPSLLLFLPPSEPLFGFTAASQQKLDEIFTRKAVVSPRRVLPSQSSYLHPPPKASTPFCSSHQAPTTTTPLSLHVLHSCPSASTRRCIPPLPVSLTEPLLNYA